MKMRNPLPNSASASQIARKAAERPVKYVVRAKGTNRHEARAQAVQQRKKAKLLRQLVVDESSAYDLGQTRE